MSVPQDRIEGIWSPSDATDYTSIEKFNTWCASENTVLRDRCAAFVMHVTHGLKVDQAMDRMSVTCVPDDIDRNDIIDMVTRILALAAKADPRTKGAGQRRDLPDIAACLPLRGSGY